MEGMEGQREKYNFIIERLDGYWFIYTQRDWDCF